jgi:hypothetical protein
LPCGDGNKLGESRGDRCRKRSRAGSAHRHDHFADEDALLAQRDGHLGGESVLRGLSGAVALHPKAGDELLDFGWKARARHK